jgi:hypothetical protein
MKSPHGPSIQATRNQIEMNPADKTVGQLLDAGLNVLLDIHAEEDWKAGLTHGDDGASNLYSFWLNFALTMAKLPNTPRPYSLTTETRLKKNSVFHQCGTTVGVRL